MALNFGFNTNTTQKKPINPLFMAGSSIPLPMPKLTTAPAQPQTLPMQNSASTLPMSPLLTSPGTISPTGGVSFNTQPIPQVKAPTPAAVAPTGGFGGGQFGGGGASAPIPTPTAPVTPTGTAQNAPGTTAPPATPAIPPETQAAYDSASKAVQDSMKISPEELSTQADIDKLLESTKSAYQNTSGQAIPLEFITGQLKSIETRANTLAEPLQTKLARLQATRTASLEASKFALDQAQKKIDATKPIAGSSFYDPNTKSFITAPEKPATPQAFTLSPGENRYDANGKLIASGGPKPLSETAQAKATADVEAKAKGKSDALDNYSLVNSLLAEDTNAITGIGQNPLNVLGVTNGKAINEYNQLKGILALENRQKLKGSGAISDFESRTLQQAASSLGRNLSNADFQSELKRIRGAFATAAGLEANVKVTSPTGETIVSTASRSEIDKLISEGNTVEYN